MSFHSVIALRKRRQEILDDGIRCRDRKFVLPYLFFLNQNKTEIELLQQNISQASQIKFSSLLQGS
jgi:hypothetical protein